MSDPMVFQFIGETVSNATDAYVQPAAANLIGAISGVAIAGLTVYFLLQGYAIMTGAVQSGFWTFCKTSVKSIVICAFALNAGNYASSVVDVFTDLETGLASALNNSTATSIYGVLDASLGKGLDLVKFCFQKSMDAGFSIGSAFVWAVAALIIAGATLLISVLGGSVIILAKFSLAVMFALGPLFIMCLLFPPTARFFDAWFSMVLNYVLTIVIFAVVMAMAMAAFDAAIAKVDLEGDGNPAFAALEIFGVASVLAWIIKSISTMAAGLAGGMSMAAMGIRHMISPIQTATSTANAFINPVSTRRDMSSGLLATDTRIGQIASGNSLFSPAYRSHLVTRAMSPFRPSPGGSVSGK